MITFGELRRFAAQWGVLPDVAERTYTLDWLLKGIFNQGEPGRRLVLRGESALSKAYFADYPPIEGIECGFDRRVWGEADSRNMRAEFERAAQEAASASGLTLTVASFEPGEAKFEFVGPLGRRSAAQPHLSVRLMPVTLRHAAAEHKLIHPFSDTCDAIVRAVSLEELAAEHIASLRRAPRVRDVFDLWFIITHGVAREATNALAEEIALEKNSVLPNSSALFSDPHRAILARGWDKALQKIRTRPAFEQVEADLSGFVK